MSPGIVDGLEFPLLNLPPPGREDMWG